MDDGSTTPETPDAWITADHYWAQIPEALLYDPAIPADAVRLFGVLHRHGQDPSNCFPGYARLARLVGKSPRSIPGWIKTLEAAGWITRVERWKRGDATLYGPPGEDDDGWEQTSNGYLLHMAGRAGERAPRAGERTPPYAEQRGGAAPHSAPKESQGNESQGNELERDPAPASAPVGLAALFAEFWQVYPRHTARRTAELAWPRAVKRAGGAEIIIDGARRYAADPNREDRFTAHGATWLNADRWEDGPLPARGGASRIDQKVSQLAQHRPRPARPGQQAIGGGS